MTRHGTIREGVIAGVLGATGVAAWFLVVDTIAGQPFFTPRVLGDAVKYIVAPDNSASAFVVVALYTVLHYAVFIIAGIATVALIHGSAKHIGFLAGMVMLFVAFEVGFYGFVLMLQLATPLEGLSWYQVGAANLIAAALMGRYLWMMHPELTHQLNESLSGRQ
jgi:hypothetical protein